MNALTGFLLSAIIAIVFMILLFVFLVFNMIKLNGSRKGSHHGMVGRLTKKHSQVPDNLINTSIHSDFETTKKVQCNNDTVNDLGNQSNTEVSIPSSNYYSSSDSGSSSYSDSGSSGGSD